MHDDWEAAVNIEVNTLYHVSVTVSALLGILLLYNWRFSRGVPAVAWWGAGMFFIAVGLALVAARGAIHPVLSIAAANAVILIGAALLWTGIRIFDGRKPHLIGLFGGPAIWLAACLIPAFYGSINARTILGSAILGIYTLTAAYDLWQGRAVPLLTRWSAIGLLAFHGVLFFVRIVLVTFAPLDEGLLPGATSVWFMMLHYEVVLYEIALAFQLFAMAKERSGQRLVIAGMP